MKLKIKHILVINQCLLNLDPPSAQKQKAPDATAKEAKSYDFSAKVAFRMVTNLGRTQITVDDVEAVRQKTIGKYVAAGETQISPDKVGAFQAEFLPMLEMEQDIDLLTIDVKELDLDKNKVPWSDLAPLIGKVIVGEL